MISLTPCAEIKIFDKPKMPVLYGENAVFIPFIFMEMDCVAKPYMGRCWYASAACHFLK